MNHIDKNVAKLFEYAVDNELAGKEVRDLCEKIGLNRSRASMIRTGRQRLTHDQLYELVKLTGANVNWIYGLSKEMFIRETLSDPVSRIRQALAEIESEQGKKKKKTG